MIPIHEFSTGIKVERTPNGGWVSLGFLGKYINSTLEPIPYSIERSIANQEFALTEGASTDQPAIIGRVVGTGEDSWAVIAVVTRARDEKRRSLSVYRYFLTPGANNLRYVLAWWEGQGRPTFNPLDSKNIGQCAYFDPASAPSPDLDPTANYIELVPTKPTLLEPQQYNLTTIHTLAIKKHNLDPTQPISWAFNVEAVEKPHSFQMIQPASLKAYETLEREISKPPRSLPAVFIDEAALKSAIRALINNSQVKADAVQVIVKELDNPQITPEYWKALFDAQGANTAITQRNYSPPLVRLMTLRAIVIPETLPEFLKWLNIKSGKQPSEAESTSLQFQGAIRQYFPKEKSGADVPDKLNTSFKEQLSADFKDKLTAGIKLLIPQLLEKEISPESIQWLFIKDRVWDICRSQFLHDVVNDLQLIRQKSNFDQSESEGLNFPQEMWQELISSLHSHSDSYYIVPTYKPLAKLFELLREYELSAYFYQVSVGQVPVNVFSEVKKNHPGKKISLLGIKIDKKKNILEKSVDSATKINGLISDPLVLLIPVALILILLGFTLYQFYPNFPKITWLQGRGNTQKTTDAKLNNSDNTTQANKPVTTEQKTNPVANTTPPTPQQSNNINTLPPNIKDEALKEAKFKDGTMTALNNLMKRPEISDDQEKSQVLRQVLNLPSDWNFSDITSQEDNKRNPTKTQLVEAIYQYQKSEEGLTADGIIDNGGETYKRLKPKIEKQLTNNRTFNGQ
ncbi:hypothetical protein NWP22_12175 [Anabaenopsis tanganyikae CS-531]|uniref:Uncharacterized protein n=1 Tax=Anabaenopsis tanganyikae CS-531 TaxID=2785304 RepID=A0ABT6KFH6_9CYAN|nr:hypothetical protein [Anabaenopsis tanganyikae]MDH6106616.1 hypothetical protein [Anabaenopsis tanganyikae CS-531]